MTKLVLKNHQVWHDLTEILENLNANALVKEHLELCNYKVDGYWDEQDRYYDEIILPRTLASFLVSSSIGVTQTKRFLKLKFVLMNSTVAIDNKPSHSEVPSIGTLVLVYDENLEFIDENWVLDVDSPHVEAKSVS